MCLERHAACLKAKHEGKTGGLSAHQRALPDHVANEVLPVPPNVFNYGKSQLVSEVRQNASIIGKLYFDLSLVPAREAFGQKYSSQR